VHNIPPHRVPRAVFPDSCGVCGKARGLTGQPRKAHWIAQVHSPSHFVRLRACIRSTCSRREFQQFTVELYCSNISLSIPRKFGNLKTCLNRCSDLNPDETSDSPSSPASLQGKMVPSSVIIDSCELRAPVIAKSTPAIGLRGPAEMQPDASTTTPSPRSVCTSLRTRGDDG